MPIFDFACKVCGEVSADKLVSKHNDIVKCECGERMMKSICASNIGGMNKLGQSKPVTD